MNIHIKTVPHALQRYNTCGDYYQIAGVDTITVSELGNKDYEFLVALHELVELWLTRRRGISHSKITAFDKWFENNRRTPGTVAYTEGEPGDDPSAPYRDEHCIATGVERVICGVLGVSWEKYEKAINNLAWQTSPSSAKRPVKRSSKG